MTRTSSVRPPRRHHARPAARGATVATSSRYDLEARARWHDPTWLVLDDLGAEYSDGKGSFRVDLDELDASQRTLVITTNCTAADFRSRYGERIVDRGPVAPHARGPRWGWVGMPSSARPRGKARSGGTPGCGMQALRSLRRLSPQLLRITERDE